MAVVRARQKMAIPDRTAAPETPGPTAIGP
jgi:hypothetical protein